jgi:hypothetical protein
MSTISKEIAALDAVIDGSMTVAEQAMNGKADLKQANLALRAYSRINTAVDIRLESRLNQGRLLEIEAKLINAKDERSGGEQDAASASALDAKDDRQLPAA